MYLFFLRDTAKTNYRKHQVGGSITTRAKHAQKAYPTSSNMPQLLSVTFYMPSRFQHIPTSYIMGEMNHLVLCILAVFTNGTQLYSTGLCVDLIILLSAVRNSSFLLEV